MCHLMLHQGFSGLDALKAKVEDEINRLLREKIIAPAKYSEWAAPVVPILKSDGHIRLCGDYKLTVNRVSTLEQYPFPRVADLFALLGGGKQFTKLDMSHAYQQIILDENSKKYLTVNTHEGLFTYNRLPFWGCISTCCLPENYGRIVARYFWGSGLFG